MGLAYLSSVRIPTAESSNSVKGEVSRLLIRGGSDDLFGLVEGRAVKR